MYIVPLVLAAKVDEETLLKFSRDDLQDLFNGPEQFLLRRRLWTIIEKSVSFIIYHLKTEGVKSGIVWCQTTVVVLVFTFH
jgi:hypothetical protein